MDNNKEKIMTKEEAMQTLLEELEKGIQSAEENGWIPEEEFNLKHFGTKEL